MDYSEIYLTLLEPIVPLIQISGWLAFTIAICVMLINMVINAATGKGFNIGREK